MAQKKNPAAGRSGVRAPTEALRRDKKELCSIETFRGSQVRVTDLTAREKPEDPRDAFVTTRQWQQPNYFIGWMRF